MIEFWAIQLEVTFYNDNAPYFDVDFAKTETEANNILRAYVDRWAGKDCKIKGHTFLIELNDRKVYAEAYRVTL